MTPPLAEVLIAVADELTAAESAELEYALAAEGWV